MGWGCGGGEEGVVGFSLFLLYFFVIFPLTSTHTAHCTLHTTHTHYTHRRTCTHAAYTWHAQTHVLMVVFYQEKPILVHTRKVWSPARAYRDYGWLRRLSLLCPCPPLSRQDRLLVPINTPMYNPRSFIVKTMTTSERRSPVHPITLAITLRHHCPITADTTHSPLRHHCGHHPPLRWHRLLGKLRSIPQQPLQQPSPDLLPHPIPSLQNLIQPSQRTLHPQIKLRVLARRPQPLPILSDQLG